jgi:hypothetical protein
VGVLDLAAATGQPAPEEGMTSAGPPQALVEPPADQVTARRERLLRNSYRRLRTHIARHETAEQALRSFAADPDVGGYDSL